LDTIRNWCKGDAVWGRTRQRNYHSAKNGKGNYYRTQTTIAGRGLKIIFFNERLLAIIIDNYQRIFKWSGEGFKKGDFLLKFKN
jgi:hypothetical protein